MYAKTVTLVDTAVHAAWSFLSTWHLSSAEAGKLKPNAMFILVLWLSVENTRVARFARSLGTLDCPPARLATNVQCSMASGGLRSCGLFRAPKSKAVRSSESWRR